MYIKNVSKSVIKPLNSKKVKVKVTKKRLPKVTTLYRSLYNRFGKSNLVKHSKYISRTECFIALYLSFYYTVIQQYKISGENHVYDIYLPKFNLLVEYDGSRWHKNKKHDDEIDKIAKSHRYKIIRIKEKDYYKYGKLNYVKKLLSLIDISMSSKHLTPFQKNILNDFWK